MVMELTISLKRKFQHKIAPHVRENRKPKWLTICFVNGRDLEENKKEIVLKT